MLQTFLQYPYRILKFPLPPQTKRLVHARKQGVMIHRVFERVILIYRKLSLLRGLVVPAYHDVCLCELVMGLWETIAGCWVRLQQ